MFGTDLSMVVWVDVMAGVLSDVLTRTVNNLMPDIPFAADVDANMWVTVMFVLEFETFLTSLEDLLLFCCITFSCLPITVLGCRALQA